MEYDEHRISIAKEIGRRFLVIDVSSTDTIDGKTTTATTNTASPTSQNDTPQTQTETDSNHHKRQKQHHIDASDTCNHNGEEHNGVATDDSGGGGGGGGEGCDSGGGAVEGSEVGNTTTDKNNISYWESKKENYNDCHKNSATMMSNSKGVFRYGNDDHVLDVLNDDLITRVREKITSEFHFVYSVYFYSF